MMYPGAMPDYMGWMMLGQYLFWAAVVALAAFAVVRLTRASESRDDARSILAQRLARGEISEEEFRSRLALVRG